MRKIKLAPLDQDDQKLVPSKVFRGYVGGFGWCVRICQIDSIHDQHRAAKKVNDPKVKFLREYLHAIKE